MMYKHLFAVILLPLITSSSLMAQFGGGHAQTPERDPTDLKRPMSVFNDQICRFSFRVENTIVSTEYVHSFLARYRGHDYPEIMGAYADESTNALVVVGPPTAEHSIRLTLATAIVESQEFSPPTLKSQKRALVAERKNLLLEMATLEQNAVGVTEEQGKQVRAALDELRSRLDSLAERISIVEKYQQLMNEE